MCWERKDKSYVLHHFPPSKDPHSVSEREGVETFHPTLKVKGDRSEEPQD